MADRFFSKCPTCGRVGEMRPSGYHDGRRRLQCRCGRRFIKDPQKLNDRIVRAAAQKPLQKNALTLFAWKGHSWEKDLLEEHLSATEMVVEVLLSELSKIGKQRAMAIQKKDHAHAERLDLLQSKLVKKISKFRTDKGRNVAVKFARTCNDPGGIYG